MGNIIPCLKPTFVTLVLPFVTSTKFVRPHLDFSKSSSWPLVELNFSAPPPVGMILVKQTVNSSRKLTTQVILVSIHSISNPIIGKSSKKCQPKNFNTDDWQCWALQ